VTFRHADRAFRGLPQGRAAFDQPPRLLRPGPQKDDDHEDGEDHGEQDDRARIVLDQVTSPWGSGCLWRTTVTRVSYGAALRLRQRRRPRP
jgi:hypothetical protein